MPALRFTSFRYVWACHPAGGDAGRYIVRMTMWRPRKAVLLLGVMLGVPFGCALPPKQDTPGPVRSEVGKVICLYSMTPFASFDAEGDPNVEGFGLTVVLASRRTGKGISEDGIIRVKMYRLDRVAPKKSVRTFVREWTVDTAGLTTFKSGTLGDGYKFQFQWAEEDDVLGHDVDVMITFEGRDGRLVRSQTKSLKVPSARIE